GYNHTCLIERGPNKKLICWGDNSGGHLEGTSNTDVSTQTTGTTPLDLTGLFDDSNWSGDNGKFPAKLALGAEHSCVLFNSGEVSCWGSNLKSQLAYPQDDSISSVHPLTKIAYDGTINIAGTHVTMQNTIDIDAGANHTCALVKEDGDKIVKCWGDNTYGQVNPDPNYSHIPSYIPFRVELENSNIIQIATGENHSCALFADFSAKCWGYGFGNSPKLLDNAGIYIHEGISAKGNLTCSFDSQNKCYLSKDDNTTENWPSIDPNSVSQPDSNTPFDPFQYCDGINGDETVTDSLVDTLCSCHNITTDECAGVKSICTSPMSMTACFDAYYSQQNTYDPYSDLPAGLSIDTPASDENLDTACNHWALALDQCQQLKDSCDESSWTIKTCYDAYLSNSLPGQDSGHYDPCSDPNNSDPNCGSDPCSDPNNTDPNCGSDPCSDPNNTDPN
ncbi:hypothetical protein BVY03_00595, partial [bacterium K02(2017)]